MHLLQLPPLHTLRISASATAPATTFLHGSTSLSFLTKPSSLTASSRPPPSLLPAVRAQKAVQGRVVCHTNNKTVNVEVIRFMIHPKYKRRVRVKKKFQAHDPENKYKVGDRVQLERCRPISKTKHHIAVPIPPQNVRKKKSVDGEAEAAPPPQELGIPLESQQV